MIQRNSNNLELNDWSNEATDPESLQPSARGSSWRSWTVRVNPSNTGLGAGSISSAVSHWSIDWIARWTPRSRRKVVPTTSSGSQLSNTQDRFLLAILGENPRPELQPASVWYIGFLEFNIREGWISLFRPVLKGINLHATTPCSQDMVTAFRVLETIVVESAKESFALSDVVDRLYNDNMLEETDVERSHASQLVLAAFGWISSLYPARLDPEPRKLQIINSEEAPPAGERRLNLRPVRRRKIKTFSNYEQNFDYIDQPFYNLLRQFGNIVPKRNKHLSSGQVTPSMALTRPDDEWIELSLLCFATLNKVASIKIEWVESLSLHLEFDSHTKVLKLFRLPSFCLLMCCCERISPFSQLFSDSIEPSDIFSQPMELEDASDFYREVLLTYRLIFGQDRGSYRDFNAVTRKNNPVPKEFHDSLLSTLCGDSWESSEARQIYEMIEAEDPATLYNPSVNFPFLGKRLLDIQRYVRGHTPRGFMAIWNDKRNPFAWWTFWAVIILGGATLILTLVLGTIQTAAAVLQVLYTKEQLRQAMIPTLPA